MTTSNIFELADTWNNDATVFDAIAMVVTDTASNTESNFLRLSIGGTDQFRIRKDGELIIRQTTLTGSNASHLMDLAVTWNTTGTPTAILLDITDTASNAASLLMSLSVGGSSRFKVAKTGDLTIAGQLRLANSSGCELVKQSATNYIESTAGFSMSAGTGSGCSLQAGGVTLGPSATLGFTNSNGIAAKDTLFVRDAANIWAQRNGTNAQTNRLYGTYTDASNYRRVSLSMTTAGVATLLPEGAGTGSSGNVLRISGLPTSNPGPGILWNNAGTPAIGT